MVAPEGGIVHFCRRLSERKTVTMYNLLFFIFFSRGDEVLVNREVGHLMRTKSTAHQDGGVSSGRANLDSPYLV